jgi:2,3-bisphosphoglycerate-dependent phosphoglycerate mutase
VPPPGGESLKDTSARVLPFFIQAILPRVMRGERTLVVAHGNSLRSLVMVLDRLSPEAVASVEFATGDIHLYQLAPDTTVAQKQVSLA